MKLGERLEIAIANATGRGMRLDLGKPIREYEDYEPHVDPPRRRVVGKDKGGRDITIPGVTSAEGKQNRPRVATGWTHEQLAFAAAGMHDTHFAALLWCLDMDPPSRTHLKAQLLMFVADMKARRGWPQKMRRKDCDDTGLARSDRKYAQDLCTLALRQAADPRTYHTEVARAEWFGISERHWRRELARGYHELYDQVDRWYASALSYLKERLRSPPPAESAQTKERSRARRAQTQ